MGIIKKMVTDTNAVAQEKGLECVLLFAENCKGATKTVGEVIDGIVLKCVAAPKTKTKDLAHQIIMTYVEIETQEKVIEGLLGGLAQKNPKIVSACVHNVTEVLKGFGAKVIKISPLLKAVIPLLDHRDKDVRENGKKLIIESYRWIGVMMKSQLTGVKPVQMTEFEAEFEKLESAGRAVPTRWLRSQGPPKQEKVREVRREKRMRRRMILRPPTWIPTTCWTPSRLSPSCPKTSMNRLKRKSGSSVKRALTRCSPSPRIPNSSQETTTTLLKFSRSLLPRTRM